MVGLKFMLICCSLMFAVQVEYGDSPAENLDTYYQSGLDFYQSRAYQNAKSAFEKASKDKKYRKSAKYELTLIEKGM